MISATFQATELPAPPPPWAVAVSLMLIGVITALLVVVLPPSPDGPPTSVPTITAVDRR